MDLDFLKPVDSGLIRNLENLHNSVIGKNITIHTETGEGIDLQNIKIAILGVRENRREEQARNENIDFDSFRRALYSLYLGNWELPMADLGDLLPGETVEDTDYALKEILTTLYKNDIIPIILGGSQDLTYTQYRSYDILGKMINVVNIDARFDIGDTKAELSDRSYIGKMIIDEPHYLFNYTNIGYQSYLNPPEEINLIENLYFEAYRLGAVFQDPTIVEPLLRDADLVSFDTDAIAGFNTTDKAGEPNGFTHREICTLARYAGISDNIRSFGIYNLHHFQKNTIFVQLVGQILWYILEGINFRKAEHDIPKQEFLKYNVPLNDETLVFYKSKQSDRWWVEVPMYINDQFTKKTYLSCGHGDYQAACNDQIPDRWYKARRRNEL